MARPFFVCSTAFSRDRAQFRLKAVLRTFRHAVCNLLVHDKYEVPKRALLLKIGSFRGAPNVLST